MPHGLRPGCFYLLRVWLKPCTCQALARAREEEEEEEEEEEGGEEEGGGFVCSYSEAKDHRRGLHYQTWAALSRTI